MALVLDWQKKLGYSKDPFEGIMLPSGKYLVGMREIQERLNLFLIKEERFGTISGEQGTGKTMLLQWMDEELAPQKSHFQHLLDGKMKRDEIVDSLLETRLSFFEKRLSSKLKLPDAEKERELLQRLAKESRNILLIDNAGGLGRHELELLADISAKTPTHIIIADTDERLKRLALPEGLSDKLKLRIPGYTGEQLADLLQRRIEAVGASGTFPFDQEELNDLVKRADRNPAKLLAAGRERAIELSLKVRHSSTQAPPQVRSTSFFSIKVAKVAKSKPAEGSSASGGYDARKPAADVKLSPTARQDGDLLAKIIETSEHPAPAQPSSPVTTIVKAAEPEEMQVVNDKEERDRRNTPDHKAKHDRKTKHDKVVEHLAEEFSRKASHAKKRTKA